LQYRDLMQYVLLVDLVAFTAVWNIFHPVNVL
jgi:hypothetical protein